MDPLARILPPYTRRVDNLPHRLRRILLIVALGVLAMFMGLLIAVLPQQLIMVPAAPVILLAAFALWLAPDGDQHLDGPIRRIFLALIAISMVWPDYVALVVPGIGWASPMRVLMGALFLTSAYALATSSRMRHEVVETAGFFKPMWIAFLCFYAIQLLVNLATVTLSSRFFFAHVFYYFMYLIAAWSFRAEGTMRRFMQIVVVAAAIQGFYGLWEHRYTVPIWAGHIPSFLAVDPELTARILTPTARAGTEMLRIGSIYATSLTYAEFIAIALPFVIFGLFYGRHLVARIAAFPLIILMLANAVFTNSRSAMVGVVISLFGLVALVTVQRFWKFRHQRDLLGAVLFWSYPAFAALGAVAVLVVPRLRVMVLGGGQHQASNSARSEQWRIAIGRLKENPIGHGHDSAGEVIGYTNAAGVPTVDSYYIALLMDYGVLGFIAYGAFFIFAAFLAFRTFVRAETEEERLAGPLAISLTSFIVIKSVLMQQENHYLAFALAGMSAAIAWRQEVRLRAAARDEAQPAAPAPGAPGCGWVAARSAQQP